MDTLAFLMSVALTFAMTTCCYGSGGYGNVGHGYGERTNGVDKLLRFGAGFQRFSEGVSAPYNNADRQLAVNLQALRAGTGTGTGLFYGVPGSGIDFGDGSGRHGNRYGGATSGSGNNAGYHREYQRNSYVSYGGTQRPHGNSYGGRGRQGNFNNRHGGYNQGYSYNQGNNRNTYTGNVVHGYENNVHGNAARYSGPIITRPDLFH